MRFTRVAALAVALYVFGTGSAKAGSAFLETFDSGSAIFTTDDPTGWMDQAKAMASSFEHEFHAGLAELD